MIRLNYFKVLTVTLLHSFGIPLCQAGSDYSQCPKIEEACVNQVNLNDCHALVDNGCSQIATRESCPLQFKCMENSGNDLSFDYSQCPTIKDSCMNEDNLNDCHALVDKGCSQILTMESCPLQFKCILAGNAEKDSQSSLDYSQCPTIEDSCMNEDNLSDCHSLVDKGCSQILTMESCPLQFKCIIGNTENGSQSSLNYSQCPTIEDSCMNNNNLNDCHALVDKGCSEILRMESCPLQFACDDSLEQSDGRGVAEINSELNSSGSYSLHLVWTVVFVLGVLCSTLQLLSF